MESFQIFQTGGREKFLKKKRDKKAKVQEDNRQASEILKLQRNIQRFLELKRANEAEQNRMYNENQSDSNDKYWKYWLLTSYNLRTYGRTYYLIQFWDQSINGLNQVQCYNNALVNRMVKQTIQFLPQILTNHFTLSLKICSAIFGLIKSSKYIIKKSQVKSILLAFNSSDQTQIINLKTDLLDILFQTRNTSYLDKQLFTNEFYFIEYLTFKIKDILNGKCSFNWIQEIVIQIYPLILESQSNKMDLEAQKGCQWFEKNYDQISKLYSTIKKQLQASIKPPQIMLVWFAFLNNLTCKLKEKVLRQINNKNKINPKLFDSLEAYQEYIQQKQEYFAFKYTLTGGDYEKTKNFIKSAIFTIIKQKNSQIPEKNILQEQAMQYVNEVLISFGEIDFLPMNISVDFLLQSINETIIYGLGKTNGFSFNKNNLSHENKILFALNIILKSALQTPDLYFVKFYQQKEEKDKLKRVIREYLLKTLKHTLFLPHPTSTIKLISCTTRTLLENFYNKIFRTNIISTQVFEDSSFTSHLKSYEIRKNVHDEISLFLSQFPYIFSLRDRAWKFRQTIRQDRRLFHRPLHRFRHHDNQSSESDDQDQWNFRVKIRRNYEFVDAFDQLRKKDLRIGINITFINQLGFEEKGFDAGGLTKQFLNRVLKDALNPNYGMFIQNSVHQLLPHPIKAQLSEGIQTQYYEFIGKLIGLAIYWNITLGYKFSGTFLNAIVGKKNSFDDLRTIDPELYKSLVYIKDMKEDASQLELTFMYTDNIRKRNVQLLPNGHLIKVTNQNKRQYISLLSAYKVNKLMEYQTRFIRKGLTSIINQKWLFMFNYQELNYIISGQGTIDIEDLRNYTRVLGFKQDSLTMSYFWQIVMDFTEEQKSKLLMFVTACPRPSFLGFKQLNPPFTITCMKDKKDQLPISHTCSNVLQLPDYNDKEVLFKKLTTAIESNAGFEFA